MLFLKQHCLRKLHLLFPPNLKFNQILRHQSFSTLSSLLNLCNKSHLLKQFHARCILHGHYQNHSLSSKLIECYANLGHFNLCFHVFNSISNPSLELYNRVLQILAKNGEFEQTLKGVDYGKRVHGHLLKLGFDVNEQVGNELAEFYGEFGEFENAREVLDEMPVRGLDHWNSMIVECLQNENARECFRVFKQMMEEGIRPNSVSLINLLRASAKLNTLKLGVLVHGFIVVSGLSGDLAVSTALLTMYSKLGDLKKASLLFEVMPEKDRVVWNLMISACTRYGHPRKSLELLVDMSHEGIRMDLYTALAAIPAVGELKLLEWGKQSHAHGI